MVRIVFTAVYFGTFLFLLDLVFRQMSHPVFNILAMACALLGFIASVALGGVTAKRLPEMKRGGILTLRLFLTAVYFLGLLFVLDLFFRHFLSPIMNILALACAVVAFIASVILWEITRSAKQGEMGRYNFHQRKHWRPFQPPFFLNGVKLLEEA